MILFGVVILVTVLLCVALVRLGQDPAALRRLQHSEYRALVRYIWYQ
jgi:hypothetical protein